MIIRTIATAFLVSLGLSGVLCAAEQPAAQPGAAPPPAAGAPLPGCNAQCVRANSDRAIAACAPLIEAQSPTDFDWLQRPVPGIFQEAEQPSANDFVVRYRGDSIRFQTPGKDWVRMSYECGYDVEAKQVAFVAMHPGRLNLPAPSVRVSVVLPTDARPTLQRGAAPMPAPAAMTAPQASGQQAVPQRPVRKIVPRIGEPSPIEIGQQPPRVRP